jgi:hypothetical protein
MCLACWHELGEPLTMPKLQSKLGGADPAFVEAALKRPVQLECLEFVES